MTSPAPPTSAITAATAGFASSSSVAQVSELSQGVEDDGGVLLSGVRKVDDLRRRLVTFLVYPLPGTRSLLREMAAFGFSPHGAEMGRLVEPMGLDETQ